MIKMSVPLPPVSRIGWNDEKIMRTRRELNEVKTIMKDNVRKMVERGGRLDELVERAQRLEEASDVYHKCAVRIHRESSWKHKAFRFGIIAVSSVTAVVGVASLLF